MNQFTSRQMLVLCALSMGVGALLVPPMQGVAQPPQNSGASETASLETPQPLATPEPADSGRTTRAIGTITGQGTAGFISKFVGPNAIGNSVLFENAGKIGIGINPPPGLLSVRSTAANIYPIYGLGVGNTILGSSSAGVGVYGQHTNTSGDQAGVLGESNSSSVSATGVWGTIKATAPGATSAGVRGLNFSKNANGYGVYGSHAGTGSGVYGTALAGTGVYGYSNTRYGIEGNAPNGTGVYGRAEKGNGVSGASNSGIGVVGTSYGNVGVQGNSTTSPGMFGRSVVSTGVAGSSVSGAGMFGASDSSTGVYGSSNSGYGLYGISNKGSGVYGSSFSKFGIEGSATSGTGVYGYADTGNGVSGSSNSGTGVVGTSQTLYAVHAVSPRGTAVYAQSSQGVAGIFTCPVYIGGNLQVTGTLSKGAGSFKIDHPQRPATEYLSHSFVESPDMMNVYNGNATTNSKGEAWVKMPSYFQSLNRDFRYQLTPIGQFAQAIVGSEIQGNRFLIRTDKPNVKVSWQVTGIRNDAYARQNRIRVEENKVGNDQGKYLYPAGFGFGQDKQIGAPVPRLAKR